MRWIAAVLAFVALQTGLNAASVRAASWNVRNYNEADRVVDGRWTPSAPKSEDEKTALRKAILAVRPDVIVFQEMGPAAYLEELRRDLVKEGLEYPFSAHLTAADPERCLAALSRIPFASVDKQAHVTYRSGGVDCEVRRGLLALTFVTEGCRWTLFDIHLKSRETGAFGEAATERERLSEAEALRGEILKFSDAADDSARWMLAGDLNDHPGGSVWRRLLSLRGKSIGVDLRPSDARGEYWTYYFSRNDSYERIDLLMASPVLAKSVPKGAPTLFAEEGMRASDHRMPFTDLVFPDAGNAAANGVEAEASEGDGSVTFSTQGN
jgi:endonuclease/exonuclease/phosphatase family metal-dependent hydrolase